MKSEQFQKNEFVEMKDDADRYLRLNEQQLFELFVDVFSESDQVEIFNKCKNNESIQNAIIFQRIFILKQVDSDEARSVMRNLFLGIRGAF